MEFTFKAYGHENVRSQHKSTFEITTDKTLTPRGDCIIATDSEATLTDIPDDIRYAIMSDDSVVEIILKTENSSDIVRGNGSSKLTLTHPSDMVCRRSDFICDRTLIINADKSAKNLDEKLVNDLKNGLEIEVTIKIISF